jgi:acid phosphatase type 7
MSLIAGSATSYGAAEWGSTSLLGAKSAAATAKLKLLIAGAVTVVAVGGATAAGVILGAPRGSDEPSSPSSPPGPVQQILLSPGADHASLQVTWSTPYGSSFEGTPVRPDSWEPVQPQIGVPPVLPRVEWSTSSPVPPFPFSANASSATYTDNRGKSNYTSPVLLNSTLAGLAEGATVYYRVGDDANGFSPVYTTRTPPPVSTPSTRIAFLGDLGTTDNSASTLDHILANHAANPIAAAALVGDISYADGNEMVWDTAGILLSRVASSVPFLFSTGNHEWFDSSDYSFTAYNARFRSPASSDGPVDGGLDRPLYYSYDIGLVHLVHVQGYCPSMRSTKTQPCLANGTAQRAWLVADLAAVDRVRTPWVVVTFHQPYVNSNTAHPIASEGLPMQLAVEQILQDGAVDVVLSGHVHAYEFSCRAANYTCVLDGSAPYYITIGDGGNREGLAADWVEPQPAWSLFRQASYGHGILSAANATHLLWEWYQNPDLAPTVAHSVWIEKGMGLPGGNGTTGMPIWATEEGRREISAAVRGSRLRR